MSARRVADVVHFGRLQEGGNSCPNSSPAFTASEQTVLADDCPGPDGALNDVRVDLDATVEKEALKNLLLRSIHGPYD